MSNMRENKVTLYYVELGRSSITSEETSERSKINRKVAKDNPVIMAYPYPMHYKIDRRVRLAMYVNADQSCEYYLVFVHCCLAWQHTRSYKITQLEYVELCQTLNEKYFNEVPYVYEATEHVNFTVIDRDFNLSQLQYCIGE